MPAPTRLKRRADFQRLTRFAKKRVMPGLILQALPQPDAPERAATRIGFTVSRRVGGAVVRNRAKRRLREAARLILANPPAGYDLVLIGRKGTPQRSFADLLADLDHAAADLGVVQTSGA